MPRRHSRRPRPREEGSWQGCQETLERQEARSGGSQGQDCRQQGGVFGPGRGYEGVGRSLDLLRECTNLAEPGNKIEITVFDVIMFQFIQQIISRLKTRPRLLFQM